MEDRLKYEVPTYHNWSQLAKFYHPLQAGSIDGTDTYPHDKGILRALLAKYKPNKRVQGDPNCTIFVGRLSKETKEATLLKSFSKYGKIKKCRLVRDVVTGLSKGYAFIEYEDQHDAKIAYRLVTVYYDSYQEMYKTDIDGREILVDYELERTLKGWIPRRLGGGFGGKKESGQLRFGGRDRPFRRPIPVKTMGQGNKSYGHSYGSDQDRDHDKDRKGFSRDSRDHFRDRDRDRDRDRNFERDKDSHRDRSSHREHKPDSDQKDRPDITRDRRGSKHDRDKTDRDRHRERRDHSRHDSHRKKDESRRKDREHHRDKRSKS